MVRPTVVDLQNLAQEINSRRQEFINALCYITTYEAATYEIDHVVDTLIGADKELSGLPRNLVGSIATYLPSNVILFSYVLYAVIPSVFCEKVIVRPSLRGREVAWEVNRMIRGMIELPIKFEMYKSRREFWLESVSSADIVAFTGKCKNSFEVSNNLSSKQLFLYFGSGVNPAIVGENANLNIAADDIVKARTFNSGQDCLCPDLILISESNIEEFLTLLLHKLQSLRFGALADPEADYSGIVYPNVAEFCLEYSIEHAEQIVYSGSINVLSREIHPTVFVRNLTDLHSYNDFPEFFAPMFNVAIYHDYAEIEKFVSGKVYRDHAMGVSLYGAKKLSPIFKDSHMVSYDSSLFEMNYGNRPFGGSGICASYVKYDDNLSPQPILISRSIRQYLL